MKSIVLIDGHSMINRAFYGVPALTNSKGQHTNAVYGFFNIMFSVLDDIKPDCLMVAFDLKEPTFRHNLYDAYKGTRKPMPQELKEQVPVVKELLAAMDIPVMTKAGWEADDILGTMARRAEGEGYDVCILSGDRDLLQLATDKTRIRMPHTKGGKTTTEDFYASDVLERYQVTPAGIIELKALMGDSSDNIPGVPKIGEKTATELIKKYGNIENLKEHRDEVTKNSIRQTLMDNFELAELSKTLATIDVSADLPYSVEDARLKNIYTDAAYELAKELEFKSFLSRFEAPVSDGTELQIVIAEDESSTDRAVDEAKKRGFAAVIISDEGAYLAADSQMVYDIRLQKDALYERLRGLFADEKVTLVTFELKEELSILDRALDMEYREGVYDLKIMMYLQNPLTNSYTLDGTGGAARAAECFVKFEPLIKSLREQGMDRLLDEMEMPLVYTLSRMERAGVLVRRDELKAYGERLLGRIEELESGIYEKAGEKFNINSPKQLGVILFEKLGLPGGKKTKTGYSTAADVLEALSEHSPIVADILEYRALTKLNSTYAVGLSEFIGEDGRIHSRFNQTVTATGRLSSSDPNLQNIPVRTPLGRQLRKVFVPREGCVFVDADYSQIELRILACMSGDERLIEAYGSDMDIHRITASQVFHTPADEVTDQQRRNAKAVNFGIVYGISSFGLSKDLSITREEAKRYIEDYFKTYPQVEGFLKAQVERAKQDGYVTTLFGRRRPVPEISAGNFMQRQFGERVAMNSPVQGTAADIMKLAMLGVERRLKKEGMSSRIVLQVHDELLIEAPEAEADKAELILKEEMSGAASLPVELVTEVKTGESWYEAH